jgi:hypothetical protein
MISAQFESVIYLKVVDNNLIMKNADPSVFNAANFLVWMTRIGISIIA